MRINPITPVFRVKPMPPMTVSYTSLPVRTVGYEPVGPGPGRVVVLVSVTLLGLGSVLLALYG
ncbi:MAG TPA: hypothetical protein PKA10_07650 [Selenomonadales bacterium]|nr:hypothetical protein [Selenomonadales bacterium]